MPRVSDFYKDTIYIDSVDEIPSKYRQEVLDNINEEQDYSLEGNINPGRKGEEIFGVDPIRKEFESEGLIYFGHGTTSSLDVDSIFKEGLIVKNPKGVRGYDSHLRGLDSTAVPLGYGGSDVYDKNEELLNNWPHLASENVIIIAIPSSYTFVPTEVPIASDFYEQFYVGNDIDGYVLRPEFIKGVYNSSSHTFTPNENFYQNLTEDGKAKLFEELDDNYIKAYSKNVFLAPGEFDRELPIDESRMDDLYIGWYTENMKKLNNYNLEQENRSSVNSTWGDDEDAWEYDEDEWGRDYIEETPNKRR